jgi:hypothetical protein
MNGTLYSYIMPIFSTGQTSQQQTVDHGLYHAVGTCRSVAPEDPYLPPVVRGRHDDISGCHHAAGATHRRPPDVWTDGSHWLEGQGQWAPHPSPGVGYDFHIQLGVGNTSLALSALCDNCSQSQGSSNLRGCAFLLQLWMWECFPIGRLYRGEPQVWFL